jgi:hypothetical protein
MTTLLPLPEWLDHDAAHIEEAEYRSARAVNFSTMKLMAQSPAHYQYAVEHPTDGNTTSRDRLRAAHAIVLEPHNFDRDFAVWTGQGTRATKAYKSWAAENEGKTLIKSDEYDQCCALRQAVHRHPIAGDVLSAPGWPELAVRWVDRVTGLECKGRIDWLAQQSPINPDRMAIFDLKQIDSTDPRRVAYHVGRMGWHVQAAHYSDAIETLSGTAPDYFILVAEGKAPHDVGVFYLHPEGALHLGQRQREKWMQQIKECRAADKWPGRSRGIDELILPEWMAGALEDDNDSEDITL